MYKTFSGIHYHELENEFRKGNLHPADLKKDTVAALDEILTPVRRHFEKGKAKELYEFIKRQQVTR